MMFIEFSCDYTIVSPTILAYKIDSALRGVGYTAYTIIDKDCFLLTVKPYGKVFDTVDYEKIVNLVNPYLFPYSED